MSSSSGVTGSGESIAVARSIVVEAPQARAFDVFVDMTAWWPLATHTIGAAPARASIVEPYVGGRWYDIDRNGDETTIGRVVAYEPPHRVVLTWGISHDWKYDPNLRTEIEVQFIPESATRTRVEFVHRGLEAYGERAEEERAIYDGDEAWTRVLQLYVEKANA
jgi:uncharacterized protein YndB with AHSA1/START domain